jgi:hypothetical protein
VNASHPFVAAVMLLLAGSSPAAQILVNRGFENGTDHYLNWTVNAPILVKQYPSSFQSPGLPPSTTGPWGLELAQNATTAFAQTNAQQEVIVAPGTYQVSANVWARVFDNEGGFSRARFRLLADGVQVEQIDLVGSTATGGGWTPWTKLETAVHTVTVTNSLGVFVQMRADGVGSANSWGQVVADFFSLDAVLIPEPSTAFLLAAAAIPLAFRRRGRTRA